MSEKQLMVSYYIVMIFLFLLFISSTTLDDHTRNMMLKEEGPIEIVSASLHFICFTLVAIKGGVVFFKRYPYFTLFPLLFGFRELDFDNKFTTTGILKIKFFTRPDVPLYEKAIGFMVIFSIVVLVAMMIKKHFWPLVTELKKRSAIGVGVIMTIFIIIASNTLDGLGRKTKSMGLELHPLILKYSSVAEEIVELGIPILMILMFSYYFSIKSNNLKTTFSS